MLVNAFCTSIGQVAYLPAELWIFVGEESGSQAVVGTTDALHLMLCGLYLVADAEVPANVVADGVPRQDFHAFLLDEALQVALISWQACLLCVKQVKVKLILATPEGESASFVVGSDDDESLVGMFLVELVGYAHTAVHGNELFYVCCAVVGVASLVYHATFHHKEETVLLLLREEVDACASDVL